jgi:putative serine protease PepD
MHNLLRPHRRRLAAAATALASIAALAGCGSSGQSTGSSSVQTLQSRYVNVVKGVSASVVLIETQQDLGSGVVYDTDGDIVTNAHVVAGATKLTVTLAGGQQVPATLVGADTGNDLAVIHMTGLTPGPAPATFADSSTLSVGDIALAIGNPLGLHSSVTEGIVSSVDRSVSEGNGVTLTSAIQTSAAINPGNSGGALVNLSGQVIGVPTLAALDPQLGDSQASGIGFAISSNQVKTVAARIIAGQK